MDKGEEVSITMSNCTKGVVLCSVMGYEKCAEGTKVNVLEMECLKVLLECHKWIELGMRRCVGELELKGS